MRRSARGLAPGLALAAVLALAVRAGGCTPELCLRNSDCAIGLVCLPSGACGIAEVPGDAAIDDSAIDALVEIP